MNPRLRVVALIAIGAAAGFAALKLFPRAFPAIALENTLTQRTARAAADSFFNAHQLADSLSRRVVEFRADREVLTFVDLAAGGSDSLNAMVRGTYAAPFDWWIRAFEPGQVPEARVSFAPSGRILGFRRKLADSTGRPDIGADSATGLAYSVLTNWLGETRERWTVAATSFRTVKPSDRVDRTITFERTDRKVGDAPLRLDVVIAGDLPAEGRPYVHVPESFTRRYAEMRSANDLYAIIANVFIFALMALGVWTIRRFSYHGLLRWRPAMMAGGVVGVLVMGAAFNSLGAGWAGYDTAQSAALHQAILVAAAVASGVAMFALTGLTLVAAEAANRIAFPRQLDWWKLPNAAGTREVAGQVLGGYVVALIAFAYVATFYLITRSLGWWVPSEILDDPNQIATAAPWLTGVALSLQAGVWEEALFRVLPLSLLSLWVGNQRNRTAWMVAGVIASALIFGFAHSNYPSWPPYSRGVEIFFDACFWAFLFLRFGAVVVMLAHFAYDLVLFSLFTATGSATEYRVAAAIALVALLAPGIYVLWRIVKQRGFVPLSDDLRFAGWTKPAATESAPAPAATAGQIAPLSERSRQLALAALAGGLVLAFAIKREPIRGAEYTAGKDDVMRVTDSIVTARGVTPGDWRRLITVSSDTQPALSRFLRSHRLDSLEGTLARTYATPAWWIVRYVKSEGTVSERATEWRVRVFPDGRPFDARRLVPDSAPGASLSVDSARRIARSTMTAAGFDLARFRESDVEETPRPARKDIQFTWIDTTIHLPEGANARAWVTLAGAEPLVARRGIQLPESFLRQDRGRQTRVLAMGGLLAAILLGAIFVATFYAARRRPVLVDDVIVREGSRWPFVVALTLSMTAVSLNRLPSTLYSYDTASPWANHVVTNVILVLLAALLGAGVLIGIWNVMEMLRRRAGIVAWPSVDDGFAVQDAIVAGLGLGATFELSQMTSGLGDETVAAARATLLDAWLPALTEVLALPNGVIAKVVVLALPILALVATARSNRMRWTIFVATIVLSVAMLAPVADTIRSEPWSPLVAGYGLARGVLVVAAIVQWGRRSALTWLVAALVSTALGGTHEAMVAVTSAERVSHAVAVLAALAGLTLLLRYAQSRVTGAPVVSGAPSP